MSFVAVTAAGMLPFVALALLPLAAAQLARSSFLLPSPLQQLLAATLTPAAAFLLGLFLNPGQSWVAAVVATSFVALPALAIVAGARDGRRRDHVLLLVFAVTAIAFLSGLLGVYAAGKDPGRVMAAQSAKLLPDVLAFYRSSGVSEGFLSGVRRAFTLNELALTRYFPGLVLVSALLYGVLLVYPFGALAGLRSRDLSESPFSRFSTPIWAAALFVPAGAAAALAGEPWRAPAVDILLPLIVLFFLRGLAIIRALLDQARAGCVGQALIFALVLLTPFPVIVALGGLFDEFLNFRGRLARRDTDHD